MRGVIYGQSDVKTFLDAYAHYDHMLMTDGVTSQTVSK